MEIIIIAPKPISKKLCKSPEPEKKYINKKKNTKIQHKIFLL